MPLMESRKDRAMPPMSSTERRSTILELHQTQTVSNRAKSRLESRRGGVLPSMGARLCWTTEPPPLT